MAGFYSPDKSDLSDSVDFLNIIDNAKRFAGKVDRENTYDDSFVDRLHNRYTVAGIVCFCVTMAGYQYLGKSRTFANSVWIRFQAIQSNVGCRLNSRITTKIILIDCATCRTPIIYPSGKRCPWTQVYVTNERWNTINGSISFSYFKRSSSVYRASCGNLSMIDSDHRWGTSSMLPINVIHSKWLTSEKQVSFQRTSADSLTLTDARSCSIHRGSSTAIRWVCQPFKADSFFDASTNVAAMSCRVSSTYRSVSRVFLHLRQMSVHRQCHRSDLLSPIFSQLPRYQLSAVRSSRLCSTTEGLYSSGK